MALRNENYIMGKNNVCGQRVNRIKNQISGPWSNFGADNLYLVRIVTGLGARMSSNSSRVLYDHSCTNKLTKYTNSSLFPQTLD